MSIIQSCVLDFDTCSTKPPTKLQLKGIFAAPQEATKNKQKSKKVFFAVHKKHRVHNSMHLL